MAISNSYLKLPEDMRYACPRSINSAGDGNKTCLKPNGRFLGLWGALPVDLLHQKSESVLEHRYAARPQGSPWSSGHCNPDILISHIILTSYRHINLIINTIVWRY